MALALKQRINRLITNNAKTGCWVWQGSISQMGYGRLTTGSRTDKTRTTSLAHRVSYEAFTGKKIPKDMTIDHLCKNKACVNPDHLEVVTQKVNVHRANPLWKQEMARTQCPKGHEYSETNTYLSKTKSGGTCRSCKACNRERCKARYWERRLLSHAL